MGHTYTRLYVHAVWSTKDRRPLITPALQAKLYPYVGGIARKHGFTTVAVGGIEDHIHILLTLPGNLSIAKAVQLIKGGSAKWVNDTVAVEGGFAWQEGYGAFTIGVSQVERTVAYIEGQAEHHQKQTFQEEFIQFLETHGIEYDPRLMNVNYISLAHCITGKVTLA
ncbi:MAG TPA: IS200/IS605 family transposase [Dehalococcoidia bacterium]|jgi:REP element-mobilizing transposase RayT|nr:IS200/IS605 family transposase [Dehalococcoidia bacterium]